MEESVKVELERIHDEDKRQNKRIDTLEDSVKEIHEISLSVHELAINMQHMLEELKTQREKNDEQDSRIKSIKDQPGQNWNTAKKTAFTAIVSCIGTALGIGLLNLIVNYLR